MDNDENTTKVFDFENRNTENGFKKVKRITDALSKKYKATVVFSHELTSEYHANIREYLVKNEYNVIKLEAKHSKKFVALFNDRVKTDKIDKNRLARKLKFFYEKDIQKTIKGMPKNKIKKNEPKDLTIFRAYFVKERSKFKNKLKIISFVLFPEIENMFSNFFGNGAMFINKKYPAPEYILKAGEEQLAKELAENSNNVFGKKKAKELYRWQIMQADYLREQIA
ncbi:MAG: transposase [Candidatus Altarchaeum sp.]|nr:transposase [Candidatus Altarchaeum sp.]